MPKNDNGKRTKSKGRLADEVFIRLKLKQETGSLLDVEEGAAFLDLSKHTVRAYIARREIPFLKIGASVRLDPIALAKWRDAKRVPTLVEQLRAEKAAVAAGQSPRGARAAAGAGA
jgi:excisionase family DNA binding protein